MKNVLVIGSSCVDVILYIERLPKTEENICPREQRVLVGGCAFNVANILKRAGAEVTFITPVGLRGLYGEVVRRELDALGLRDYVALEDDEDGCCYCFVEQGGERTFAAVHGVEYTFDPAWMKPYQYHAFDYGYLCGLEVEETTGEQLARYVRKARVAQFVYAPGPRAAYIPRERNELIFDAHPILHLNAAEAMRLAGCPTVSQAAQKLACRTERAVIVTLGAQGVYWRLPNGQERSLPACNTAVVDTIGAGDAHAAAMMLCLMRDMTLENALAFANKMAARVVAVRGATLSDDDLNQMLAHM